MCLVVVLVVGALHGGVAIAQTLPSQNVSFSTGIPTNFTDASIDSNLTTFAKLWDWTSCTDSDKGAILGVLAEAHSVLQSDGWVSH